MPDISRFKYDVALSYATEDSEYASRVAQCLRQLQLQIFFDRFEEDYLWGRDLYFELDEVFRRQALCCVVFLSNHYAAKIWTNHERQSIQARALEERREYILPVRLDSSEVPGIRPSMAVLDGSKLAPETVARKIETKVKMLRQGGAKVAEKVSAALDRGQGRGRFQLARIYQPYWFGGGAYALFADGRRSRLAEMTQGFVGLNNFKGTACALMFDIEPSLDLGWVKVDELRVQVNSYSTLPEYKPLLPKPYEEANVYYVEIDNKPGESYIADFHVENDKRDIGFLRVFRGRPETVIVRVNAKAPGLYKFDVQLLLSTREDRDLIAVVRDQEFAFDEIRQA